MKIILVSMIVNVFFTDKNSIFNFKTISPGCNFLKMMSDTSIIIKKTFETFVEISSSTIFCVAAFVLFEMDVPLLIALVGTSMAVPR